MVRLLIAAALFAAAAPNGVRSQQPSAARHDIVRGRVTTDSGAPIRGADVVVTRISDASPRTATTDATGAYTIDWPNGSGDYALTVSAPGFRAYSAHLVRQ
ncbi:MAG TPA: carboxypeptidase-like regulatory domain-containing protein, partial [Gemmatimonadaceae bacterium]|nr:carboxypeptidase-like regulatory domain-containing protein [Gemmatimonadaceae bacterium]